MVMMKLAHRSMRSRVKYISVPPRDLSWVSCSVVNFFFSLGYLRWWSWVTHFRTECSLFVNIVSTATVHRPGVLTLRQGNGCNRSTCSMLLSSQEWSLPVRRVTKSSLCWMYSSSSGIRGAFWLMYLDTLLYSESEGRFDAVSCCAETRRVATR